jgi:hypothetical protein
VAYAERPRAWHRKSGDRACTKAGGLSSRAVASSRSDVQHRGSSARGGGSLSALRSRSAHIPCAVVSYRDFPEFPAKISCPNASAKLTERTSPPRVLIRVFLRPDLLCHAQSTDLHREACRPTSKSRQAPAREQAKAEGETLEQHEAARKSVPKNPAFKDAPLSKSGEHPEAQTGNKLIR